MLCCGVCISLSVVVGSIVYVYNTVLQSSNPADLVVIRENRLQLQKDLEAVEVLAVVAAVLYMTYLWRALFKAPASAPEPQPSLEVHKEEKQHQDLRRRPLEHKETQYELYEEAQYVTVETQTDDSFVPVDWTSSESQFSDSSLSMMSPPLDTHIHTGGLGTIQQEIADVETNGTSPNYPQTSTADEILQKETTLESMVQEVLELQVCKGPQKSEGQRGNSPIGNVAPPVESPRSETPEKTTSPRATEPQLRATTAKPQLPTGAGDFETPPHSASDASPPEADSGLRVIHKTTSPRATEPQLHATTAKPQLPTGAGDFETPPHSASDASPPEADSGPRVIHKPAVHSPRKPVTFTVSLESDQSPRRSMPSPGSPGRTNSCLPIPKAGFRRRVCINCRARDECQRNADGSRPTTATAMAAHSSTSPRGGGDAVGGRVASRLPAAGRGCRLHPPSTIKGRLQPAHTYSEIHCRQGAPCAYPTPAYACRPPSYEETNQ